MPFTAPPDMAGICGSNKLQGKRPGTMDVTLAPPGPDPLNLGQRHGSSRATRRIHQRLYLTKRVPPRRSDRRNGHALAMKQQRVLTIRVLKTGLSDTMVVSGLCGPANNLHPHQTKKPHRNVGLLQVFAGLCGRVQISASLTCISKPPISINNLRSAQVSVNFLSVNALFVPIRE